MYEPLLEAIGSHPDRVVLVGSDDRRVTRSALLDAVRAFGSGVEVRPDGPEDVWVAVADPVLNTVAALGSLSAGSSVLLDPGSSPSILGSLARACPPALVVTDDGGSALARWAGTRGLLRLVDHTILDARCGRRDRRPAAANALKFLTSGTTGLPRVIALHARQILAATRGVSARLELGPADTAMTLAAQNHTLGLVTGVLTPLVSGGAVAFGSLARPAELVDRIAASTATWCAASPSIHRLVHQLTSRSGFRWPGLRVLRSSAAALPADLAEMLEAHYRVPVVNAYVLTEAPGEVASQPLAGERVPGTVGVPTLCEVQIRFDDRAAGAGDEAGKEAGKEGVIWVRGPNVYTQAPDGTPDWWQRATWGSWTGRAG